MFIFGEHAVRHIHDSNGHATLALYPSLMQSYARMYHKIAIGTLMPCMRMCAQFWGMYSVHRTDSEIVIALLAEAVASIPA